jgi:hypothetical protein
MFLYTSNETKFTILKYSKGSYMQEGNFFFLNSRRLFICVFFYAILQISSSCLVKPYSKSHTLDSLYIFFLSCRFSPFFSLPFFFLKK